MTVPMMNIRKMCMRVRDRQMPMLMHMRLDAIPFEIVFMPMMLVMSMPVRMRERLVRVGMFVTFPQMQPYAERH